MKEIISDGIRIFSFDILDSTNKEAMRREDIVHLSVISAERQSSGRGRLGRSFFSPNGGLYMSVVLDPEKIKCGLGFCTAAAALAVKEALRAVCKIETELKWVNDLLVNGKKICGILTEAKTENGKISRVVVGIGINLANQDFPDDIKHKAASINYSGDKTDLIVNIVKSLQKYIETENAEITETYSASLSSIGKHVEVTDYSRPDTKLHGTVVGVDNNCFLRLKTDSENIVTVSSGEIIG